MKIFHFFLILFVVLAVPIFPQVGQCIWDGSKYVAYSRHEVLECGQTIFVYICLPEIANEIPTSSISVFVSIANENCTDWQGVEPYMSKHYVVTGNPNVFKEPKFELQESTKFLAARWFAEQIFRNDSGKRRFVSTRVEFYVPKKNDSWLITGQRNTDLSLVKAVKL